MTTTVVELITKINELDARIRARFDRAESDADSKALDSDNADDREEIHSLTMTMIGLLDVPVIVEALGDAAAYRIPEDGDTSDYEYDKKIQQRYKNVAVKLIGSDLS